MANKKLDDDDDDDDDDLDAAPAAAGEDEDDLDAIDDDEDEEGGSRGRGRLIAIISVVVVLLLGVSAGGYFFLFSGSDDEVAADTAPAAAPMVDDGTTMTIARGRRMLTSEELAKQGGGPTAEASPGGTALSPSASSPQTSAPPGASTGASSGASSGMTPPPATAQPPGTGETAAQQQSAPAALAPAPAAPAAAAAKGIKGKGAAPAPVETAGLVTPAATAAAYRDIPVLPAGKPLSAPDPNYTETTEAGTLPRARGTQGVWKAYARPFDGPTDKPRVAIIITGLGLSRAATLAAISQMAGGITLAFDPHTRNLEEWVGLGRSNGHEALLHLPMEPNDFPVSDPGPMALLTDFDATQNIDRMHQVLASAIGYVGVVQVMGSKFTASDAALRPALEELKKRGLLFVNVPASTEDRSFAVAQEIGLPVTRVDLKLDSDLSAAAIDSQINELEKIAREKGRAVAIAEAYPITLARLSMWMQSLSLKEITLAPVSAMVQAAAPTPPAAAAPKGAKKN